MDNYLKCFTNKDSFGLDFHYDKIIFGQEIDTNSTFPFDMKVMTMPNINRDPVKRGNVTLRSLD